MDGVNSRRRGLLSFLLLLIAAGTLPWGEAVRVNQASMEGLDNHDQLLAVEEKSGICFGACLHGRVLKQYLGRKGSPHGDLPPRRESRRGYVRPSNMAKETEIMQASPPFLSTETPSGVETPLAPPF